jgi:hypothetical protein
MEDRARSRFELASNQAPSRLELVANPGGNAPSVWREYQIPGVEKRAIIWQRFIPEYVEGNAPKMVALYRIDQSFLIDEAATRGVNEKGTWLHHPKLLVTHQSFGLGVEAQMQRHDV